MTKTKSQKLRAKAAKAGSKRPAQQKSSGRGKQPRKINNKKNKKNRRQKGSGGAPRSRGAARAQSGVSDGLNTGMVWKNTNSVSDYFKPRFEKVADLVTVGAVNNIIAQYYLNPGNTVLFPVFGQIAATYEEYICHLLRFWYRGEEYTASGSNVTAGILAYATNMDPDDSNFANVSQMENYEGCVSGPPFSGHFCHDVEVAHRSRGRNRTKGDALALNQYFVYSSGNAEAPAGQPGKFYDMGNFQVMENKCQAAAPAGELWVEHSWTMIRRKQQTPLGQAGLQAHFVSAAAGTATAANPLGTTGPVLRSGSTIPITFNGTYIFSLPLVGTFLVAAVWQGSNIGGVPTLSTPANTTLLQVLNNNASTSTSSYTASAASILAVYNVTTAGTNTGNEVQIGGLASMTGGNADIYVVQVSTGLLMKLNEKSSTDDNRVEVLESKFDDLMRMLRGSMSPESLRDYDDFKFVGMEKVYKDGSKSTAIEVDSETVHIPQASHRNVTFAKLAVDTASSSSSSTASGVTSWLGRSK